MDRRRCQIPFQHPRARPGLAQGKGRARPRPRPPSCLQWDQEHHVLSPSWGLCARPLGPTIRGAHAACPAGSLWLSGHRGQRGHRGDAWAVRGGFLERRRLSGVTGTAGGPLAPSGGGSINDHRWPCARRGRAGHRGGRPSRRRPSQRAEWPCALTDRRILVPDRALGCSQFPLSHFLCR